MSERCMESMGEYGGVVLGPGPSHGRLTLEPWLRGKTVTCDGLRLADLVLLAEVK